MKLKPWSTKKSFLYRKWILSFSKAFGFSFQTVKRWGEKWKRRQEEREESSLHSGHLGILQLTQTQPSGHEGSVTTCLSPFSILSPPQAGCPNSWLIEGPRGLQREMLCGLGGYTVDMATTGSQNKSQQAPGQRAEGKLARLHQPFIGFCDFPPGDQLQVLPTTPVQAPALTPALLTVTGCLWIPSH